MTSRRLRAPRGDGALLADPPLAEAGALLAANARALAANDHDFQGRRAGRLRAMARRQALDASRAFHDRIGLDWPGDPSAGAPWVVTGHQPELFHPGVWVKNVAVAAIAREGRGVGLNLIVDNDTPKSASVRVPERTARGLKAVPVEFDQWAGEVPYEDLNARDPALFASFPARVLERISGQVEDPLIKEFWPLALDAAGRSDRIGERFAAARHGIEQRWGVRNYEVPLGLVCETEAFHWFASHLLAQLPRYWSVHNAALDRHRASHGIRSRHHPVPALGREGDWLEAPFWAWRAASPRRRPLLARQRDPATLELRIADEPEPFLNLPLGPDREACCAVEVLQMLPEQGIRLRTRALTTTLFARLLLGDLFLHGIGGAKYDELGDEVARGFLGAPPPPFLTLSLTLWLGLPDDPATADSLHAVDQVLRDLDYNPDRHLTSPVATDLETLIRAKWVAIEAPQASHRERVERFRAIRRYNEALRGAVEGRRNDLIRERERLAAALRHNQVARSREYPFVLHDRRRLHDAMARAVPGAFC
ncbi:MAG TPA: hypothetical protein VG406_24840 [Isosphaeraceae bacterium]|jgi:hypothetical protein|nr:hypothetical protein [Isosphaeraceae bacterium]